MPVSATLVGFILNLVDIAKLGRDRAAFDTMRTNFVDTGTRLANIGPSLVEERAILADLDHNWYKPAKV